MIEHTDTIKSGHVYSKHKLAEFHKRLFRRGSKINIGQDEEGVFLERVGSGSAWILTDGGAGGKVCVPIKTLEDLNKPTVKEEK